MRVIQQYANYLWWPDKAGIVSFGPAVTTALNWNYEGQLQDWLVDAKFAVNLARQTGFTIERYDAADLYLGQNFRNHNNSMSLYTSPKTWLSLNAS